MKRKENFDEIIFENRNKEYGAYELRRKYSKRGTFALIVAVIVVFFAVGVPLLAGKTGLNNDKGTIDNSARVIMAIIPDDIKVPPPPPAPKTPEMKEIIFKAPKIVIELTDTTDVFTIMDDLVKNMQSRALDTNTRIVVVEKYKEPELVEELVYEPISLEEQPRFLPDGDKSLLKYIGENTVYPLIAQENGIEGTVYVRFVVTRSGEIGKATVMRAVDPDLEAEALRVVKSMPKWVPGKHNGNPVNVWFIIPVKFKLQNR
jgi:protein TonB